MGVCKITVKQHSCSEIAGQKKKKKMLSFSRSLEIDRIAEKAPMLSFSRSIEIDRMREKALTFFFFFPVDRN